MRSDGGQFRKFQKAAGKDLRQTGPWMRSGDRYERDHNTLLDDVI